MTRTIPPALSIGAVLGDSDAENTAWLRAINSLSRSVQSLASDISSPLHVNVVYHVDGKLAPNEFRGVRTGRFDRRTPELMVQVAVPVTPTDDRPSVVFSLLREAVGEAEGFARRKGLTDELGEIRRLVERLHSEQAGP